LAIDNVAAVKNIHADPDVAAYINPQFQKELDLVREYIVQGKDPMSPLRLI
jgi:hypothetical protein